MFRPIVINCSERYHAYLGDAQRKTDNLVRAIRFGKREGFDIAPITFEESRARMKGQSHV